MENKETIIKRARQTAIIAGIFSALTGLLLIFNHVQMRTMDPLESQAMEQLVSRLSAEPDNEELMQEIRQLDLLARRAYFNSLWQLRTGIYLLLAGSIVFVVSLRVMYKLQQSISIPADKKKEIQKQRRLSQVWIAGTGAAVLLLALLSAWFSMDHMKHYETVMQEEATTPGEETIEQVDLARREAIDDPEEVTEAEETDDDTPEDPPETHEPETEAPADDPVAEEREAQPLSARSVAENHNTFRGPWGHGVSPHRDIPLNWDGDSGENILWKTRIPVHGYNTPVIWEDQLFLTGADQERSVVYCLDRHSGEIRWEAEVRDISGSPPSPPETTDDTGLAAPTMAADERGVYAIFGTGNIIGFDHDGNRLWARNLGVPDNHYGHSSSLICWDNMVFVQYDTNAGSKVMALDTENGETIWETSRDNDISWASPILIEKEGSYQLVMMSNPTVDGYDIHTGEQLWAVDCMSGEVGASPAFGGGLIYAANEYATMAAIDPLDGTIVWEDRYYLPEVSSPVYHNGLIFIATTYAVVAAFNAETGDFVWEFDAEDRFYSSPMVAEDRLYVFDTSGKAYIFETGEEAILIESPELGEPVFASPVFSDGRIYIRGNEHIFCIGD